MTLSEYLREQREICDAARARADQVDDMYKNSWPDDWPFEVITLIERAEEERDALLAVMPKLLAAVQNTVTELRQLQFMLANGDMRRAVQDIIDRREAELCGEGGEDD